jgi:GNAT superfamily N-acetyltransferase
MLIRPCTSADFDAMLDVINDAAVAYRGIIADDRWKEPYMPASELREEMNDGVAFWGDFDDDGTIVAVMGLQKRVGRDHDGRAADVPRDRGAHPAEDMGEVALVRHAYTRTTRQGTGAGTALLQHVTRQTDHPILIGTWAAATWAVRFYERHGFRLVRGTAGDELLRRYWNIPDRQIEESVVLADASFRAVG